MPRKDTAEYLKENSYLGCEVPKTFFLRFQAMAEIRGGDKRTILAIASETEIEKWESRLDQRTGQAYDALLEVKARQNGYSVNDLQKPLELKKLPRGRRPRIPHAKKPADKK